MCSLANKLKYLREKKGLTKKDVAEAVGVHPSSIGNLEKGSIPQADLLYSLAKFFDVSMEYLMNSSDPEPLSEIEHTQSQLSSSELTLLNLFSQLDELDQNEIIGIINLKLLRYRHDASPKSYYHQFPKKTLKQKWLKFFLLFGLLITHFSLN